MSEHKGRQADRLARPVTTQKMFLLLLLHAFYKRLRLRADVNQARVEQERRRRRVRRRVRATRAQSEKARRGRGMAEELAEAEQPTTTLHHHHLCSPITRAVGLPGTEQQGGEYQHVHIATNPPPTPQKKKI